MWSFAELYCLRPVCCDSRKHCCEVLERVVRAERAKALTEDARKAVALANIITKLYLE